MSRIVIFANGKPEQVDGQTTIPTLIQNLGLDPKMILVEHNEKALLRQEWSQILLKHGDRLELVRVVAGG